MNKTGFYLRIFYHQPRYTEKIQTRAYTIANVVGTVGGYVGLFMGYAIVQAPEGIKVALHRLKTK